MRNLIFLMLILSYEILQSQPPKYFKYQSVIRDKKGSLMANKAISIRLSILQGNTMGNLVYSEVQSSKTNSFGLLNLDVGKGTNKYNSLSAINWGNNRYFLKIEADTTGTRSFYELGITQLLSVPYSLNSAGLTLTSPNGSLWTIKIDNSGEIYPVKISTDSTFTCGGKLKDMRDNKEYKTADIGGQCWMAENLNTGVMLGQGQIPANNKIIEKYCYSGNEVYCNTYGGLYIWDEMMGYKNAEGSGGICPAGWHIPTDNEWKRIEIYLGMAEKEADSTGWRGTDEGTKLKPGGTSGFNALFGGYYYGSQGSYIGEKNYSVFWTSSEFDVSTAWQRFIYKEKSGVSRINGVKSNAYSVRCVEDF